MENRLEEWTGLSELISQITNQPLQSKELLKGLNEATKHMKTFNLKDAEQEIFKFVMPVILKHLEKAYNDNLSLIEISNDDMIDLLIKDNLTASTEIMKVIKDVLLFVTESDSIETLDIESLVSGIPSCMDLFFKHFKDCFAHYTTKFNEAASILFEEIQELYFLFLHLLEVTVILTDKKGAELLIPAINFICESTDALSEIDFKLVYSGWKTFSILTDKHSELMQDVIDLNIPINSISVEVEKALAGLLQQDVSAFTRYIKITNFFVKFLMKYCDNFCQRFDRFVLSFISFYIRILSFSLDRYKSAGIPDKVLQVIEKSAFNTLDELLRHFLQINNLLKVQIENISNTAEIKEEYENYPIGVLFLAHKSLKIRAANKISADDVMPLVIVIFTVIDKCYKEVFYDGFTSNGLLETLIIDISSALLRLRNTNNIEHILIQKIVQENTVQSVLALEIYTILLSYQNASHLTQTLVCLLKATSNVNTGKFTVRPEQVYLHILLSRIFKMLPLNYKMEVQESFRTTSNYQIWKIIGYDNNLSANTFVQQIFNFSRTGELKNARKEQVMNVAECLNIVSTSNSVQGNDLSEAIQRLWEMSLSPGWDAKKNNFVKYFTAKLILASASCITQFSSDQLLLIFHQLIILSQNEAYLVFISKVLQSYFNRSMTNPDINTSIQRLIMNFLNSDSKVVKEICFDLLRSNSSFRQYFDRSIINLLNENLKSELDTFLNNQDVSSFDYDSVNDRFSFVHNCINWYKTRRCQDTSDLQSDSCVYGFKNINNTVPPTNDENTNDDKPRKRPKTTLGMSKRQFPVNNVPNESEENDSMSSVIKSLKGEVKCLIKATQKEKLTPKNAADLKIIIRDLTSLM